MWKINSPQTDSTYGLKYQIAELVVVAHSSYLLLLLILFSFNGAVFIIYGQIKILLAF